MEKVLALFSNSGFTALITAIATIIITSIFALLREKKRNQQEIVRQILPERLKAHSVVLEIMMSVSQKLLKSLYELPVNRPNLIMKYNDELQQVYEKNTLWLNKGVDDMFWELQQFLTNEALSGNKESLLKEEITNERLFEIMEIFSKYRGNIQSRMRLLSGFPLLDKTLGEMVVKPKKRGQKFFLRSKG